MNLTEIQCREFFKNPERNPLTNRKIKKDGPTYKAIKKACEPKPKKLKNVIGHVLDHVEYNDKEKMKLVNRNMRDIAENHINIRTREFLAEMAKKENVINTIVDLLPICKVVERKPLGTGFEHRRLHIAIYLFLLRDHLDQLTVEEIIKEIGAEKPNVQRKHATILRQNFYKKKLERLLVQNLIDLEAATGLTSESSKTKIKKTLLKLYK